MSQNRKPYFDNLDALRFTAAFAVFLFHVGRDVQDFFTLKELYPNFKWLIKIADKGALGVNFFFVLSGFLITYLMIWETENRGSFSYKNFLVRRTFRIWPLYFLIVILGFYVFPAVIDGYDTKHLATNYWFFLANFDEIKYGASDPINFLTSPWSIAVEEQFYVVWGLLGFVLLRNGLSKLRYFKQLIFALLALSAIFRFQNFDNARLLYYHTFSVMPDLLIGCLLAIYWYENPAWFKSLKRVKPWQTISIYVLGAGIILTKNIVFPGIFVVFERYVIALFFAFIVIDQILHHRHFFYPKLHNLSLSLGRISYGIYMYHLVILYFLKQLWFSILENETNKYLLGFSAITYTVVGFILVIIISKLSFRILEKPMLQMKERFSHQSNPK